LLAPSVPSPLRAVGDQFEDAGPLAGLHAGLRAVQSAWAFAVAADMPFVDPKIVRAMLDLAPGQDAVVPRISLSGSSQLELEPLHALYSTACVSAIEDRLRSGDRRIVSFLPSIKAAYAEDSFFRELDPQHLSFFNINTPADLEFANHILTSR
jgi:molybdopterin-guanine dinucleotide biosynthesis protein A